MRRVLSLFLIILIAMTNASVYAYDLSLDYWVGEVEHIVDASDCIETENATVLDDGVQINSGGHATFGFYIPYGTRSMKIVYVGGGKLKIDTIDNVYNVELSGSGEDVLEFGTNLGYEPQKYDINGRAGAYVTREHIEHRGEKTVKITASNEVKIYKLVFEKEKSVAVKKYLPDVSEQTMETLSTVMMNVDAPVIVVNGGRRYISYEDPAMRPYNYNGSIYIPVETLAKALGYYCEVDTEKSYVLMRSGTHEVVLIGSKCTVSEGVAAAKDAPKDVIIYRDGKMLGGVRYFAELTGDTVGYKDGLIVIDNKYTVNDVLTDDSFYNFALSKFSDFKGDAVIGKTYYVSQTANASDDNLGTEKEPFKTLNKAASVAVAGDTVIVGQGIYRETLAPKNSGTAIAPITFKAAEGASVTISALEDLGAAVQYEDDVYVASMPNDLGVGRNQVFVNGEMQREARYPNGSYLTDKEGMVSDAWPHQGNLYRPLGSPDKVMSDTLLQEEEENYWAGGYYVGLFGLGYAINTAPIISSKKGELTVGGTPGTDIANQWFWTHKGEPFNWGYIVGHENALDVPGEWIRSDMAGGTLKIILPEGVDPANAKVEAKARQLVVDLKGKDYIHLVGINTIGGGARMNDSKMCMLKDMNMKYISHYTHSADQRDGYIDFPVSYNQATGAPQRGEVGIYISGSDNIVAGCVIDHSAAAGVYLTGLYTQIDNNIIKDCGYMGSYVAGIHVDTCMGDAITKPRGGFGIYNNTVYNCGRSCLNIQAHQNANQLYAPYLPHEIAYNDFHGATLTSGDTGIVYAYCVNNGFDQQMSELHHNYVYWETDKKAFNSFNFGIFWDNGVAGIDTHSNMTFYTEKEGAGSRFYVREQDSQVEPASQRVWNNANFGYLPDDLYSLDAGYFTEDRPWYAGSLIGAKDYTLNYARFKDNMYGMKYSAKDAILSEGVTLDESGYANFTESGQYICFPNVDFGDGKNEMAIAVRGESGHTYDDLKVIIGSDIDSDLYFNGTVLIGARDTDQSESLRLGIGERTGVHNVYIKVEDYKSAKIGGISVYSHANEIKSDVFASFSYAGEYTDFEEYDENATNAFAVKQEFMKNPNAGFIKDTWPGRILRFAEHTITEDSDHLIIGIGSAVAGVNNWRDQPIEVYLDDETEPIVSFAKTNGAFMNSEAIVIPLDRVVKAGTYDVKFKFTADDGYNKSSNFFYFGFKKVNTGFESFPPEVKVPAGTFDTELSVQNETRPFYAELLNNPRNSEKGILYTLPGTTAVYKDVKTQIDCSNFVLSYAADPDFDGQTIEIRIDDVNADPIATHETVGKGTSHYEKYSIPLDKPIPAGEHTIYVTFGGKAGSGQTCKLEWIGFSR